MERQAVDEERERRELAIEFNCFDREDHPNERSSKQKPTKVFSETGCLCELLVIRRFRTIWLNFWPPFALLARKRYNC